MRKTVAATTAALTMLVGCRPEVLDAAKTEKSHETEAAAKLRSVVESQNSEIMSIATRYVPELMLTRWKGPETLSVRQAKATVYQESGADTAPGMELLASAVNNMGKLMDAVDRGDIVPENADYRLELNDKAHQIYMIYGNTKPLRSLVSDYHFGPLVGIGVTQDQKSEEIITLMASFPRTQFMFNSDLDNTRWVFQSAVCANYLNIIPGSLLIEEVKAGLSNDAVFDEEMSKRLNSIAAGVCQSLALMQVAKEGESRGIVSGYDYYDWLLKTLSDGGEVANYFPLPYSLYEEIRG